VKQFIRGYKKFRREVFPQQVQQHQALANQQKPHTLFITCADSRVVPSEFTQTEAGELFQCRVVGNLVPAHGNNAGGVTSAIEYAVMVLQVRNIVICGHSDCGAMRAFLHPEKLEGLKAVKSWIEHASTAIEVTKETHADLPDDQFLNALIKENVIAQIQHLKTHPCVATKLRTGQLGVYGWYYDIGLGTVEQWDPEQGKFIALDQVPEAAMQVA
jgi:carbonic anhydrase